MPSFNPDDFQPYNPEMLGGDKSWSVDQWHEYVRTEIERANDSAEYQYNSAVNAAQQAVNPHSRIRQRDRDAG